MEQDTDGSLSSNGSRHLVPGSLDYDIDSPSSSGFLRSAANLDGLASQLDDLSGEPESEWTCCCNGEAGSSSCKSERYREGMEEKLKLAGEVGQALLSRYEALEKRYTVDKEKYESQLDIKRKSLEASITRVHNLEKANTTHMQKYAEMSRKHEALEKRYTQALHAQTLTQQSLTHVRAELTSARKTSNRQSIALASGAGIEERFLALEKRHEGARDLAEVETKKARDEARHRKRAETRIAELEEQLKASRAELEEVKDGRTRDAQDLLNNAKERLELLHAELSETFNADSPADAPEYQKALESLVADNALLRHDTSELTHRLAEARDENRVLQQEVDDLRTVIATSRRTSPAMYGSLAGEVMRHVQPPQHYRTESTPLGIAEASDRSWARMSIVRPRLDHNRRSSMAPSFTSTSSAGEGLVSPGLGLGSVGEYGAPIVRESGSMSPTNPSDGGRQSPKPGILKPSPSGGIGYVLNGVPKRPGARPSASRRISMEVTSRIPSTGIDTIPEWARSDSMSDSPDEPLRSPASLENYRAAEHSRKRRSLMLSRRSTMSPVQSEEFSRTLLESAAFDPRPTSPMSDSAVDATLGPSPAKKVHRRTLMLLSKSKGVQTDPPHRERSLAEQNQDHPRHTKNMESVTSIGTAPAPALDERSETSSIHDRNSIVLSLVDHLSRMLSRLRAADIPTLNKRLRKHNLPNDVGHLSRTTMKALHQDVSDLRLGFKGIPDSSPLSKRDFTLLLKLLKDVFTELVDLQDTVNNVTIDPKLAKKLRAEAFRPEDEDSVAGGAASGLGWIAAPITKFFVTPATEPEVPDAGTIRGRQDRDRGKLAVGTVRAPKQAPVASATTTHVSIEFGGAGIVRRAVPSAPTATVTSSTPVIDGISDGPVAQVEGMRVTSTSSNGSSGIGGESADSSNLAATLRPTELRRAKSRANRTELLGIFAGATRPISPTAGQNWVVLPDNAPPVPALRSTSSRNFQPTDTSFNYATVSGIERSIHKRGLSDSSIRSTFVSHGEDIGSGIIGSAGNIEAGPAINTQRQAAYAAPGGYGGVLGAISRRWYGKPAETVALPKENPAAIPNVPAPSAETRTKAEPISTMSPIVKPIPVSPMRPPAINISSSPSPRNKGDMGSGSATAGGGLLGYLASSLATSAGVTGNEDDPPSEDEMIGASLRQPPTFAGGRRSSSRTR